MFGVVTNIPLQMLCCEEAYRGFADTLGEGKVENFTLGMSNKRCFDRLLGYVDVDILSTDGC